MRWRTANRFAAPIVVRMPGGFGKDVGDPWHSLSDEVRFAHAYGWQVAMPSNAADAVGLLRRAMRGRNPTVFFEHRSLLMTSDGSARYPGDDSWCRSAARRSAPGNGYHAGHVGCARAPVRRGGCAVRGRGGAARSANDRAVGSEGVLASVRKTGRCVIVHEDNLTAGFGAEIAATSRARTYSGTSMRRLTALRWRTSRCRIIRSCSTQCCRVSRGSVQAVERVLSA